MHCVAERQAREVAWWRGRSVCDHCGKEIKLYRNVPILSWLVLRGTSNCCGKKLSNWHIGLELLGAGLGVLIAYRWFGSMDPIVTIRDTIIVLFSLHVITFDGRWSLVSLDTVVITIIALLLTRLSGPIMPFLFAAPIGAAFFLIQYFFTRGKGIGIGDIWLGAAMGVALGISGVLVAVPLAYIISLPFVIFLILTKKKGFKDPIPFGTFLMASLLLTHFVPMIRLLF